MVNGDKIELYNGEGIKICREGDSYRLHLGKRSFLIGEIDYYNIEKGKGVELAVKMGKYNPWIIKSIKDNKLKASNLEKAFFNARVNENGHRTV